MANVVVASLSTKGRRYRSWSAVYCFVRQLDIVHITSNKPWLICSAEIIQRCLLIIYSLHKEHTFARISASSLNLVQESWIQNAIPQRVHELGAGIGRIW